MVHDYWELFSFAFGHGMVPISYIGNDSMYGFVVSSYSGSDSHYGLKTF